MWNWKLYCAEPIYIELSMHKMFVACVGVLCPPMIWNSVSQYDTVQQVHVDVIWPFNIIKQSENDPDLKGSIENSKLQYYSLL